MGFLGVKEDLPKGEFGFSRNLICNWRLWVSNLVRGREVQNKLTDTQVICMKPRLFAFKRDELGHFDSRNRIYFVVVNLDKAKKYPANFVCVLPKLKKSTVKLKTEFFRVFGVDSLRLAKKLLTEAFVDEDDAEIRAEIQERLKFL